MRVLPLVLAGCTAAAHPTTHDDGVLLVATQPRGVSRGDLYAVTPAGAAAKIAIAPGNFAGEGPVGDATIGVVSGSTLNLVKRAPTGWQATEINALVLMIAPDGARAVGSCVAGDKVDLCIGRLVGGELEGTLHFDADQPSMVAWLPDDRIVLFEAVNEGPTPVWSVDGKTGAKRQLASIDVASDQPQAFASSDGRLGWSAANHRVAIAGIDDLSHPRTYTFPGQPEECTFVGAAHLACLSVAETHATSLDVVELATGKLEHLDDHVSLTGVVSSPDGTRVAYVADHPPITTVRITPVAHAAPRDVAPVSADPQFLLAWLR